MARLGKAVWCCLSLLGISKQSVGLGGERPSNFMAFLRDFRLSMGIGVLTYHRDDAKLLTKKSLLIKSLKYHMVDSALYYAQSYGYLPKRSRVKTLNVILIQDGLKVSKEHLCKAVGNQTSLDTWLVEVSGNQLNDFEVIKWILMAFVKKS